MKTQSRQSLLHLSYLLLCVLWFANISNAQVQKVFILKEIDDDNIIIVTEKSDKLLLKKWNLRFSPLSFEGKYFHASISPMWVTIYFDDRDPIKWSIEENLGKANVTTKATSKQPLKGQNDKVYAGLGGDHWIQKVIDSGKLILLEDGSLWEVSPIDVITSMLWLPVSEITVIENDGLFPYKLTNTDDGESVEAKYIGQK